MSSEWNVRNYNRRRLMNQYPLIEGYFPFSIAHLSLCGAFRPMHDIACLKSQNESKEDTINNMEHFPIDFTIYARNLSITDI